jgi:hypothetical protein
MEMEEVQRGSFSYEDRAAEYRVADNNIYGNGDTNNLYNLV